jgi:signal transduction histidine kinase
MIRPPESALPAGSNSLPLEETEPEQLRRQMARAIEEEYQFSMGAVHDLRSAQRGIITSVELLQNLLADSLSAEARTILANLADNAAKANALVTAVRDYASSLSAARYSCRWVEVAGVVRDALASLEPAILQSGSSVAYGEFPKVWGDRDRLQELFRRLIDNSLKYRGQSPARIEIESRKSSEDLPHDQFLFFVRDYGIGIERKYQPELFRPFRRLHGSEIPGVGLGLAICKKIAEAHGGRLWIESEAGSGTTVFFTLPSSELGPLRA